VNLEIGWETIEFGSEWDRDSRWYDDSGRPLVYTTWTDENSRVVSGPYGPAWYSKFPGRRFPSRTLARRHWGVRARILEEHRVPGRYIFRIREVA
jgi:hypothetical protein